MKTLIAFGSKTGTAKKCAQMLRGKLGFGDIVDLSLPMPSIDSYDLVIIGGSIRMGKLNKYTDNFVKANKEKLKNKRTAFFICCGDESKAKATINAVFPSELLENAIAARSFGGEIIETSALDRIFVKMYAKKSKGERPQINEDAIDAFAKLIIRKTENG